MPLITRRSSTRGTPRGLFGNSGCKRAHCPSLNQNSPAIAILPINRKVESHSDRAVNPVYGSHP
jgi:hypothetical protein